MLDLHPCRRKDRYAVVPFTSKDEYQISHIDPIPVLFIYRFYRIVRLDKVLYLCTVILNFQIMVQGKKHLNCKPKFAEVVIGDNEAKKMCES